jgi:hypothetical protein
MEANWGALQGRQTIGAGTQYAVGQIWCIDVPLAGGLAVLHTSNTPVSAAPPWQAGNQARV